MQFSQYTRQPFVVEAVEITDANIAEIAPLIGNLRTKDGVTFIVIDRRIVPNVNRAYPGWYLTKLEDHYRCYAPKVFTEQFAPFTDTLVVHFQPKDTAYLEGTDA